MASVSDYTKVLTTFFLGVGEGGLAGGAARGIWEEADVFKLIQG